MSLEELRKGKYVMEEKQWLIVRVYMRPIAAYSLRTVAISIS